MEIPKEAIKDHDFVFVEKIYGKISIYQCSKCNLECYVGKEFQGHWDYLNVYNISTYELEELSCDEIVIMDILK